MESVVGSGPEFRPALSQSRYRLRFRTLTILAIRGITPANGISQALRVCCLLTSRFQNLLTFNVAALNGVLEGKVECHC